MADHFPDYITIDEVARLLGIEPCSVREYVRTRRIIPPDLRPTARAMLWDRAGFVAWLTEESAKRQEVADVAS